MPSRYARPALSSRADTAAHGGIIHPRRTSDWYRVNRDGTLALAGIAKAAGVRRFVFVSSNAAQGKALLPRWP